MHMQRTGYTELLGGRHVDQPFVRRAPFRHVIFRDQAINIGLDLRRVAPAVPHRYKPVSGSFEFTLRLRMSLWRTEAACSAQHAPQQN